MICFFRVSDPEMPGYGHPPTSLWRRYSEFELLRNYLEVTFTALVVPVLPEKRVSENYQFMSIIFVSFL